jgi:hypothetical protein
MLAATPVASAQKRVPFQRSVTVASWGHTAYDAVLFERTLKRLKKNQHIDTITLLVVWAQDGKSSTRVQRGPISAPDRNLKAAIRAAKKMKLRVVLRPYIDPLDGTWRGQIEPTSRPAWFASYTAFIKRYATLAQREKVDGLVVGTEMTTLSGEEASWRSVVAAVRAKFKGFLAYQANWGGEEHSVKWWDAVDVISISAYYPVAAEPGVSTDQLAANWLGYTDQWDASHRWVDEIDALRQQYARPVMFGEIGYRSVPATAVEPWNTELRGDDPMAQTRAYEAAFRAWYRVPWFRGMHWWYVAPEDQGKGIKGTDHRMTASTLRVLGKWYAQKR